MPAVKSWVEQRVCSTQLLTDLWKHIGSIVEWFEKAYENRPSGTEYENDYYTGTFTRHRTRSRTRFSWIKLIRSQRILLEVFREPYTIVMLNLTLLFYHPLVLLAEGHEEHEVKNMNTLICWFQSLFNHHISFLENQNHFFEMTFSELKKDSCRVYSVNHTEPAFFGSGWKRWWKSGGCLDRVSQSGEACLITAFAFRFETSWIVVAWKKNGLNLYQAVFCNSIGMNRRDLTVFQVFFCGW
jgi:hypothetical protein